MSQRVIGLDVGSHAITAAELKLGKNGAVTVMKFGQIALRPGAVTCGEVVDVLEVSAALKRLWREAGFSSKKVVVGVGNQRVIVRPADMPAMPEKDLRSAVEFQAQELIPIPLEEAILDYQVLERYMGNGGTEMLKVLIVAEQRDMVSRLLVALDEAGLTASIVDLVPFALLRALADASGFGDIDGEDVGAEAIVSVGSGVTTMIVHEYGIPKFIRTIMLGSHDITQAIAEELDITADEAEGIKRQVTVGVEDGDVVDKARVAVKRRTALFVDEIIGSLDFHTNQVGNAGVKRIILTGGGRRVPGIAERLSEALDAPVSVGLPFSRFELGRLGLNDHQLRDAEDLAAVALGFGLAGRPVEKGARRLSLMPPEVGERREQQKQFATVAAGLILFMGGLFYVWQGKAGSADEARMRADQEETRLAKLQSDVAELGPVAEFERVVDGRQQLVQSALGTDISWSKVIQEVATVMPDDIWLQSFVGIAPQDGSPGRFTVTGHGSDHTSSARWLLRLDALESVSGLWLPSSVRKAKGEFGELSEVTFSSSGELTLRAASGRIERYLAISGHDVNDGSTEAEDEATGSDE
jgi:type IV pilus assembly protein PilM